MGKFIDIASQTFGRLTAIEVSHKNKHGNLYWKCQCECGNIHIVYLYSLKSGKTKSCGCLQKERLKESSTTHGMRNTKFYRIWVNMKARCLNKNSKCYKDYGGRGITVCEEWLDFNNFKDDMYESYLKHVEEFGEKQTTLDRIDNNRNYCKENCKWSTCKEQIANRRTYITQKWFKAISPTGEEFVSNNQRKFARENDLNVGHVGSCLKGNCTHHKQWKFKYLTDEQIKELEANVR